MDAMAQIRDISAKKTRPKPQPVLLGDVLSRIMKPAHSGLSRRYEVTSQICAQWPNMLGPELAQHCRAIDLSLGTLTIEADSPSYMYELRISSHKLLEHLRRVCPNAKLRAIKVTLAR